MRVFISEYVCGGAWPDAKPGGTLAIEGRAMLAAVVEDFCRVPGVRVTTTWDARLGPPPVDAVQVVRVESSADELPTFYELARLCDATLVIAPETQGILAERCRVVERLAGRLLGPGSRAVELCASKAGLVSALQIAGVPAIPAVLGRPVLRLSSDQGLPRLFFDAESVGFPLVVKPDDGAGSQSTYLIRDAAEFTRLQPALESDPLLQRAVWQPYVSGRAVSVGLLISGTGDRVEVFPPAEQTLSNDGRFRYLGGAIPARGVDLESVQDVACRACRAVNGLRGYAGVDLIVPDESPERPIVVEINPRLTTSYIGYRRLATENLAQRMLAGEWQMPGSWRPESVAFSADGRLR
ncbi:MAG: ATP-grasp domain-containing protein [Planctomycetaceae bacterium]